MTSGLILARFGTEAATVVLSAGAAAIADSHLRCRRVPGSRGWRLGTDRNPRRDCDPSRRGARGPVRILSKRLAGCSEREADGEQPAHIESMGDRGMGSHSGHIDCDNNNADPAVSRSRVIAHRTDCPASDRWSGMVWALVHSLQRS
jgi:hypothetical protein